MSTIYALSTVAGKSAVAIIRITGPRSKSILQTLSRSRFPIVDHQAQLRSLKHPRTNEMLDRALCFFAAGPRTFTGEDTCELHLHGSRAVINAVLEAIPDCGHETRHALPGEFSKRAFLNGKMDLTQAEGLADLINAETDEQRKSAFRQADGSLTRIYDAWRTDLLKMRTTLEAVIDFGEDNEDVEDIVASKVITQVEVLKLEIQRHLESSLKGELIRNGIRVTIFGPPNAGKSSLLNILAQKDASIVSYEAGTTRDIVESFMDIGGYPIIMSDTAGLRSGAAVGHIEQEGIKRARRRIQDADIRLCVISKNEPMNPALVAELKPFIQEQSDQEKIIIFLNKSDLDQESQMSREDVSRSLGIDLDCIHEISCIKPTGIARMKSALLGKLKVLTRTYDGGHDQVYVGTNPRHRAQLRECLSHLGLFLNE
ncbi:protein of unknown function, partial [Taphrina deformans PYCC 5710]